MHTSSVMLACLAWVVQATQPAAAPPAARDPRPPLGLAEAYRLALARSESVRIANLGVLGAKAHVDEVWSQMGPVATINGQATLQNELSYIDSAGNKQISQLGQQVVGVARVTQPLLHLDFFSSLSSGRFGVERTEAAAARTRQALMMDVTAAFIGVVQSRQQVQLAQAAVKRAEAQRANAAARVKAGGALRTAELLAAIDQGRAQIQLVEAEQAFRLYGVTFERLVGVAPPESLMLPATPAAPSVEEALRAMENRGDLLALRLGAQESRELTSAAKGHRLWPTLDAQGEFDLYQPALNLPYGWKALALLSFPLFQGGKEYTAIRRQELAAEIAEESARAFRKQIAEEVRAAVVKVEQARAAAALTEQQVKDAQENYGLVGTQFRLGAITFLEVVTAQAALTEAENLRTVAVYDRELATYQLLFAAGLLKL